jgi:TetR/AcrR family transcriptional regulator, transcriptional repressor for nem operon
VAGRPRSFDVTDVLDRAMGVFWRKGYEGTGLVDLEEATGLGRQSLYGVFGDKRGLFAKVVEHYFERVIKPGIDLLDAPGSPRAHIEQTFDAWEAAARSPGFNGCLIGNSVPEMCAKDPELGTVLARKLALMEQGFVRALKRAQRDGEVSTKLDVKSTARTFLTLAQGLAVVVRAQGDPSFVRSVTQTARGLLG